MNTLLGYKKCSTCKAIEKLLQDKKIPYEYREIDKENPTAEELEKWHIESKLPLAKWMNTSGIKYREMNLSEKRKTMSEEELYKILSTDGMLVKRPILLTDEGIYVGPEVKKYLESI